mmetsp:Transcript_70104/g.194942  ORF Transcript_70104/g.194942 Transcript_70104/m.194942 type:complete len:200 (-) Transcript_70104:34-633(-)
MCHLLHTDPARGPAQQTFGRGGHTTGLLQVRSMSLADQAARCIMLVPAVFGIWMYFRQRLDFPSNASSGRFNNVCLSCSLPCALLFARACSFRSSCLYSGAPSRAGALSFFSSCLFSRALPLAGACNLHTAHSTRKSTQTKTKRHEYRAQAPKRVPRDCFSGWSSLPYNASLPSVDDSRWSAAVPQSGMHASGSSPPTV